MTVEAGQIAKAGMQESMEALNNGGFFNVLAEVDALCESYRQKGRITPDSLAYARQNHTTAMLEAVSKKWGDVFAHRRTWSLDRAEYIDWGYPFWSQFMANGLKVRDLPLFELDRRTVEYQHEGLLTLATMVALAKAFPLQGIVLIISPFPEEESPTFVESLGYRPTERTAKVRAEVFHAGVRMTVELAVSNSQLAVWNEVWSRWGGEPASTTTELLGNWLWLDGEADEWETLALIAQEYDAALRTADSEKSCYFLGNRVAEPQDLHEYLNKFQEHRSALTETTTLVDRLMELTETLAQSQIDTRWTEAGHERLRFWLNQDVTVMSSSEQAVLLEALSSGAVPRRALEIIMTKELILSWSLATTIINPHKAQKLFGSRITQEVTQAIRSTQKRTDIVLPNQLRRWDDWVSQSSQLMQQYYVACGGTIGGGWGGNFGNFYQLPLFEVASLLGGGIDESNDWYDCPCGYRNRIDAKRGDLIGENGRVCEGCGKIPARRCR